MDGVESETPLETSKVNQNGSGQRENGLDMNRVSEIDGEWNLKKSNQSKNQEKKRKEKTKGSNTRITRVCVYSEEEIESMGLGNLWKKGVKLNGFTTAVICPN
jgi:hypothetical protein